MISFAEIEQKVIDWGEIRDIYKQSTPIKQAGKIHEEVYELFHAISERNRSGVIDAIGDILVVLTAIAKFTDTDLTTCYLSAYEEVKDRRGNIIDGVFTKER